MDVDHIEPGTRLADEYGQEITVTNKTPDGRYIVTRPHASSSILSAKTIRDLYPRAVAVAAVAALAFTGVAQAKGPTLGQREALQDARQYLQDVGGFSLSGLISQVESDGFSKANATYGATHAGANWDKEAAQDAQQYMQDVGGFSASGLISQLESDGFTAAQARYGAKAVGY